MRREIFGAERNDERALGWRIAKEEERQQRMRSQGKLLNIAAAKLRAE